MQPILTIALRAAESAADKLNYTVTNLASLLNSENNDQNRIFDKAIEDAAWRARKDIRNAHNTHNIESLQLGLEESRNWDQESLWLINVIAGEQNLRLSSPNCLVNVSYWHKNQIECTAITNPITGESLTAFKGRGVQFQKRRVRVNQCALPEAICALSTSNKERLNYWFEKTREVRIGGCELQNFFDLAAGRVQIAVAEDMNKADIASAYLIAKEAGALTGDLNGKPAKLSSGQLLAAAPKLFKQIIRPE